MAGDELERLGFSRETFDLAHPDRLWTHHIYATGTKEDILPSYLSMNFHQMLMGLPILSHILQTVTSSRGEGASSELYPIFGSTSAMTVMWAD